MKAIALVHGIALDVYHNAAGSHAEVVLNENGWVYLEHFDGIILTAENDDSLGAIASFLRDRSPAPVLVHGIPCEKSRYLGGVPFRASNLLSIAQEWMRWLYPLIKAPSKVLVVDLDDTFWRGILGEDDTLDIIPNYSLQHQMLNVYDHGIILAVCSKNNHELAINAIDSGGNLVGTKELAGWRINWEDKVSNLLELARELNVGLESFVFLDDNPVERGLVRSQLPEVIVPWLPDDPELFCGVLKQGLWFEGGSLTYEDSQRGQYYAQRRQHKAARAQMTLEDYYRSLEQRVEIRFMTNETLPRVAQLLQKTNQFNLTTRRHDNGMLAGNIDNPKCKVITLRARDKFGDNGIVGVAILHIEDSKCWIDSFLLSCRVIGRTIETAFLSWIMEYIECLGATRLLCGWYIRTERNEPCADFYSAHGFDYNSEGNFYSYDLAEKGIVDAPDWITYE